MDLVHYFDYGEKVLKTTQFDTDAKDFEQNLDELNYFAPIDNRFYDFE